jgi:D-threo-aldose 1-dehydrogenase
VNATRFRTRKLGRADVSVTELGLGTAPLGDLFDLVEDDEAASLLKAAWDGGVRYFDTSPWYGRGQAEHRVGRTLYRKKRADFGRRDALVRGSAPRDQQNRPSADPRSRRLAS